ncbi:MAG: hypothetical protein ACKOJH_10950, partial [Actinomycetota bacterium]
MRVRIALKVAARFATVLVIVTFAITVLVRLLPGDPVSILFPFATEEDRIRYRGELGLNDNIVLYYLRWLGDFVTGDFGSYYSSSGDGSGVPVSDMLGIALPRTLLLMVYVMVTSLVFAIPLGLYLAYRAETRVDRWISNVLFALASLPNFATGLGLAFLLGVKLNWLPVLGYVPIADGLGDHVK